MLIHDYGHECITSLFTAATQYSQVYFCSVDSLLDYEQSLFLLKLSSEKGERRIWPRTWLKERGGRGAKNENGSFSSRAFRAAALVSSVSSDARARVYPPN